MWGDCWVFVMNSWPADRPASGSLIGCVIGVVVPPAPPPPAPPAPVPSPPFRHDRCGLIARSCALSPSRGSLTGLAPKRARAAQRNGRAAYPPTLDRGGQNGGCGHVDKRNPRQDDRDSTTTFPRMGAPDRRPPSPPIRAPTTPHPVEVTR